MKIISIQDHCKKLNIIITEFKNKEIELNNKNNNNQTTVNKKNFTEFINSITKNNLSTGFVCNNNE
jgi:hypothetical protein